MSDNEKLLDAIVIGAGPTGLACAVELHREGYEYEVLEKGCLVNSLFHFPAQMVYFTTPELLEIGGLPFVCQNEKPSRAEALKYYRRVVEALQLRVTAYEKVLGIEGGDGDFRVRSEATRTGVRRTWRCRKLVVATGYYDNPNRLGIPGEELDKVSHYFTEPHPYYDRDVAVVGGGNSAAEAALELYRGGARVSLIHRRAALSTSLKYWVAPDIGNRIKNREIEALLETVVSEIRPTTLRVRHTPTGAERELTNDFVFALIGYHADFDFLRRLGIVFDEQTLKPRLDPESLESNVAGLYMAGVVIAGVDNNKVFIENGRFHGQQIVAALRKVLRPAARPGA